MEKARDAENNQTNPAMVLWVSGYSGFCLWRWLAMFVLALGFMYLLLDYGREVEVLCSDGDLFVFSDSGFDLFVLFLGLICVTLCLILDDL